MGDIIHEMGQQLPKTFFGLNIFLTAYMAKPSIDSGPTV